MLYQEVRPKTFDDVFGCKSAVTALRRAVESENRSHVYLLHGPSGCGKTTLARVFAVAIGADDFNVIERNAASERGIDMARRIERQAQTPPLSGGVRVDIIDECHAITSDGQSCLLKVLEDVSEYQYYCLCTTHPQKLREAIRTRCEEITVSPLDEDDLIELVLDASAKGGLKDPGDKVLDAIVENSDGCPRRAIVLLEKQDGLEEDEALSVVRSHKSLEKATMDLCRAMLGKPWRVVMSTYNALEDKDAEKIRRFVLGYLAGCLKKAKKPEEAERFTEMIEELADARYDAGTPGLLAQLYRANTVK